MKPQQLIDAVRKSEFAERERRGLPLHHVLTLEEFPFHFSRDGLATFDLMVEQLLSQNPTPAPAYLFKAMGSLARRDYAAANAFMQRYQAAAPQHPQTRMRFGHTPPEGPALPEVSGTYPTTAAFFFACDAVYFDSYGLPLLRSMASVGPDLPVHIHLFDGSAAVVESGTAALPLRVTVTTESSDAFVAQHGIARKDYYHAARLIRFSEALAVCEGPLWMADVDAIVTADPSSLLQSCADAALRVRAGRLEPWTQFSACLVMGSPASRAYFQRAADIVKADLPHAWWGLDQYALFSAWVGLKPTIELIGPDLAAVDDEPGLFWFTAGNKKSALQTDTSAYAQRYRQFATP